LLALAAAFLFIYSLALTLSPALRSPDESVSLPWNHWLAFLAWALIFTALSQGLAHRFPAHNPYLLPVVALLCGWGILTIWRLNPFQGAHQTLWLLLSGSLFLVGLAIPRLLTTLERYRLVWMLSGLALIALTFLLGTHPSGQGPHLWLSLGLFYIQPAEPLKLALIVYLSASLANLQAQKRAGMKALIPSFVVFGGAFLLLLAQRDLDSALLFALIFFAALYLDTGRERVPLLGFLLLLATFAGTYFFSATLRGRIAGWLNPWGNASGSGYQAVRAFLSLANGGLLGQAPGLGSPQTIPVASSDFILVAIGEEEGLAGIMVLLACLGLIGFLALRISLHSASRYQRFLANGVAAYLVGQGTLVAAANLGVLPVTGLTFPFVSYGGSSLATSFGALLLLFLAGGPRDAGLADSPPAAITPYRRLAAVALTILGLLILVAAWRSLVA
jgi:peptidoglycan glycosyltransferase